MIMKKIITLLAIISLSMTACADRHQTVAYSEIPVQAQAFIEKYFKSSDVAYIERELENIPKEKVRELTMQHIKDIENGQRDFRF